jgi:hypothetical protein
MKNNKFRTPKIDSQNVISFTCSDDSIKPLLNLLNELKSLGEMGCSRTIKIDWDGDGRDRVNNISINGMTLKDWDIEWKRLNDIKIEHNNNNTNQSEGSEVS